MIYLYGTLLVVFLLFAGVLLRGAPYVPTLDRQAIVALELLGLEPGQTLLELGSGDGKVLLLAAQAGLNVVGIELNPILVVISRMRTWRYRAQVRVIWGDFWLVTWPECDGVFSFLLDRFMSRLDERMQKIHRPLASFAFEIPGRTATTTRDGIHLYHYE
jgi:SAM-dependent methyltransferase